MSGIPIHTSDPIHPAKAQPQTPQTAPASHPQEQAPVQPQPSSTSYGYPSARPGQSVPAPTKTVTAPTSTGPHPPHPEPPATTAKATLPPPPKAGEKLLPVEAYHAQAPSSTPNEQSYVPSHPPPHMSQTLQNPQARGVPPASTTTTTNRPSFPLTGVLNPAAQPSANDSSLAHPPGYVQNQHATDMTAEQKLAIQQEESRRETGASTILGQPGNNPGLPMSSGDSGAGIWESAKTLGAQVGQKAADLHTDIWDRINRDK